MNCLEKADRATQIQRHFGQRDSSSFNDATEPQTHQVGPKRSIDVDFNDNQSPLLRTLHSRRSYFEESSEPDSGLVSTSAFSSSG